MTRIALLTATLLLAAILPFRAGAAAPRADIVDTAAKAGSFKTLLAAATAAGLVDALKAEGPITLFAPTDEAFAKLPKGTVDELLKPENKARLAAILTYHVLPGRWDAAKVVSTPNAASLNGQRLGFKVEGGDAYVAGAKVVKSDIMASNGVIHVIDSVILPASDNLVQTAVAAGSFNTLLTAAKAAGLADALQTTQSLTLFAPTDAAFAKLPAGTVEDLLKPENKEKLAAILKFHVVPGRVYADQAIEAGSAASLQGQSVKIAAKNGAVTVNGAKVSAADVEASNGVIHVIDSVILPE